MRATAVRFGNNLRESYIGRLEWGNAAICTYFSAVSDGARLRTGLRSIFIDDIEAGLFNVIDGMLTYDVPEGSVQNGVQVLGWQDAIVLAAQFACSPEGRKRGPGAMRDLKAAVAAYNEAQASE